MIKQEYTIRLERMEFRAYHGCYEMEQRVGNRFTVDIEITTELGNLAQSDEVSEAVNYLTIYEVVEQQMAITRHTIEAVAAQIIEAIRIEYPLIKKVKCRVGKIAPPLGGKIERVSVELKGVLKTPLKG